MEFSIEDFLPKYPNIDTTPEDANTELDPYPNTSFQMGIYNKQEFRELKLSREEQRPQPGEPYKHQQAIARFLSSYTIYNALLLDHEMGTGKSCSAFSAIESIKRTSTAFKGALVLTRGPRILDNLVKELVYVCTSGQYVPSEVERKLTDNERKRRLTKLTSDFYTFNTFEKFAKFLEKISDAEVAKRYSNMVIVIDEVHNLRLRGDDARNYTQLHRLLHVTKNHKIIIMSGTPMKDDPVEIAAILNLILPMDKQLPTGQDFRNRYLVKRGEGLNVRYTVKESEKQNIKNIMKGYVSYLKAMSSDTEVKYAGKVVAPLEHFKVVPTVMSPLQTEAYTLAYNKDIKDSDVDMLNVQEESGSTSGIYSNSRQASLFVFPNNTYGKEGFDKYLTKVAKGQIFSYTTKPEFAAALRGANNNETLARIRMHSSTYANIIESILKNDKKLHFIYDSFVHGSGSVVLGKLLQLVGFGLANGEETTHGNRYAILTNSTSSQKTVDSIIRKFNSKDNMNGKYIRIIIGSKILSEGITLKNVQEIHIATPHWNYSELAQAIARGIRLESHRALIDAGQKPVVTVYQHVAMPDPKFARSPPSIDLQMYTLCESKDISIKSLERLIKESAVDCALFYERNKPFRTAVDGSRDCDYQSCTYKCDGITEKPFNIDYSTYNLYYKSKTDVTTAIIRLFELQTIYTLEGILSKLGGIYTLFDIISELKNIITNNITINNVLDIPCYLREKRNVYFLVDSITAGDDFLSSEYARRPVLTNYESFDNASVSVYIDSIARGENVIYCFNKLPITYKREFIEQIIEYRDMLVSPVSDILVNYTNDMIAPDRNSYTLDGIVFSLQDGEWVIEEIKKEKKKATPATINPLLKKISDILDTIDLKEFTEDDEKEDDKYIGLYNPEIKKFCVKTIVKGVRSDDPRKKNTGRSIETIKKEVLMVIVTDLKLEYNPDTTTDRIKEVEAVCGIKAKTLEEQKRLCYFNSLKNPQIQEAIFKYLLDTNRIFKSNQCGKAGATKK